VVVAVMVGQDVTEGVIVRGAVTEGLTVTCAVSEGVCVEEGVFAADPVLVWVPVQLGVVLGVLVGEPDSVPVDVMAAVAVPDPVSDELGVMDAVRVVVAEVVAVLVRELVIVGVGLGDQTEGVAVFVGERLAVEDRVVVKEGVCVIVWEGVTAAVSVLLIVCVLVRLPVRL